ncbi:MAG: hypothetical protein ACRC46_08510 [Thermoguttaceae bacterium]
MLRLVLIAALLTFVFVTSFVMGQSPAVGAGVLSPYAVRPNQTPPNQTPPKQISENGHIVYAAPTNAAPPVTANPPAATQPYYVASSIAVPSAMPVAAAAPQPATVPATTPFQLTAEQQSALDIFLSRWEEFSGKVKRFEIGFTTYNNNLGEQPFSTYGVFNYIAPDKMSLHIQGEWISKSDRKEGSRQERVMADGRAVYVYDYTKKVVKEVPIPRELQGKTIATGPLPLIFGAKADDMKARYWLRLVTPEQVARTQVWLEVFPRWSDDATEFQRVVLVVSSDTMIPVGMKVVDVNGKSHVDYAFDSKTCKVNNKLDELASALRDLFTPEIPFGWKREVLTPATDAPAMTASTTPLTVQTPQTTPPKSTNLYTP